MTREEAKREIMFAKRNVVADSYIDKAYDMAIKALGQESCEDAVSRQDAINALWKALYDYEDKAEKQFQESEELDVGDWIAHRIFVQNMSDIDRQAILDLPSVRPKRKTGEWIPCSERLPEAGVTVLVSSDYGHVYTSCFRHGEFEYGGNAIAWMPLPESHEGGEQDGTM